MYSCFYLAISLYSFERVVLWKLFICFGVDHVVCYVCVILLSIESLFSSRRGVVSHIVKVFNLAVNVQIWQPCAGVHECRTGWKRPRFRIGHAELDTNNRKKKKISALGKKKKPFYFLLKIIFLVIYFARLDRKSVV